MVNGRGDEPNRHDILTGSNADGTFSGASREDWTSSGEGSRRSDITTAWAETPHLRPCRGTRRIPPKAAASEALRGTGGDGLFDRFAID